MPDRPGFLGSLDSLYGAWPRGGLRSVSNPRPPLLDAILTITWLRWLLQPAMLSISRLTPVGIDQIDAFALSPAIPRPSRIRPPKIPLHPSPSSPFGLIPPFHSLRPNLATRIPTPRLYIPHLPHLRYIRHTQTHPSFPPCRSPRPPP